MSKNEIRLRRQKLTGRGIERFRNYGAVLERHEQEKRIKKIVRVFTFFLIILIVITLLVIISRVEKRLTPADPAPKQSYSASYPRPPLL